MLKKISVFLALATTLTGCSLLSPVASEQSTYQINSAPRHIPQTCIHRGTLLVLTPKASSIYNTTDMVYSTYPHQIAYFAKSSWAATPAEMLKPLIVNTLQKTHRFSAVTTQTSGGQSYTLYTQILQLRQVFWNGCKESEIRFTLHAELVNNSQNQHYLISAKNFTVVERAPQNSPYGGVIAANRATNHMLKKLAAFCLKYT